MNRNRRPSTWSRTLALVPPVITLTAPAAQGAFDMFIKIDDIKGESSEKNHRDWSDVTGFKFGVSSENSKSSPKPLVITKRLDRSSPQLFLKTAQGASIPKVTLELTTNTINGNEVFYQITLHGVTITSVITNGGAGDEMPTEEISFNFLKIEMQYGMIVDGVLTPTDPVIWDFNGSTK